MRHMSALLCESSWPVLVTILCIPSHGKARKRRRRTAWNAHTEQRPTANASAPVTIRRRTREASGLQGWRRGTLEPRTLNREVGTYLERIAQSKPRHARRRDSGHLSELCAGQVVYRRDAAAVQRVEQLERRFHLVVAGDHERLCRSDCKNLNSWRVVFAKRAHPQRDRALSKNRRCGRERLRALSGRARLRPVRTRCVDAEGE